MAKYLNVNDRVMNLVLPKEYPISLLLVGGIALAQHYATLRYLELRK